MQASRLTRTVLVASLATVGAAPVLAQQLPAPPAATPRAPAVPVPTPAPELEFTGPEAGWPPQVRGATNVQILPTQPVPGALAPAAAARLSEVAAAAPAVRRALGDRYVLIDTDRVAADKQDGQASPEQQPTRVTFYSYSRNVAVRVLMRGNEVAQVTDVEGYQPPETPREVERAVQLAREDPRIRDAVRDLEGRALLTEAREGRPGAGRRVLYVSFLPRDSARTEVMALVDLTENRVLEAGRPAGR